MKRAPSFWYRILGTVVASWFISIGPTLGMEHGVAIPDFPPVAVDALQRAGRIGGDTYAVAVAGGYAYLGVGLRLLVVDVSDPGRPRAIGKALEFSGVIQDIHIIGDRIYLAAGEAGLRLIDASDPAALVEIGSYDTSGNSRAVHVDGAYAYVADNWEGLRVIDISDPARPVLAGAADTDGPALDVFIVANYAYVAADEDGLRIVDVSRTDAPAIVGHYQTSGEITGVYVVDGYAYLAASGRGLRVLDVSNTALPREVGAFASLFTRRVFVTSGRAYLVAERSGLWVLDVSSPTAPVVISKHATVGAATDVDVVDEYAYVADGVGGLAITSVGDEAAGMTPRNRGAVGPRQAPLFLPLTERALSNQ